MRTASPNNIKADFLAGLMDVESTFTGVSATPLTPTSKNLISEYAFLGASILLEGYISDLFVAYINKANGSFVSYLTGKMQIATTDEYAKRASGFASIDIASHLTLEQIRSVIDHRDWNVTFATSADLKQKAGMWLEDPYKSHFLNLSNNSCAVIEATKAIRNFLAHRSGAAQNSMQIALSNSTLNAGLTRGSNQVHKVGSFLDSRPVAGAQRRIDQYLTEFKTIANQLCP